MLRTFVQFGLVITAAGCGKASVSRPVAPATFPAVQLTPESRLPEPIYANQISSLTADERKAITVATAVLRQRKLLVADDEHLAFTVATSGSGWEVQVFPFSRDVHSSIPVFMPGRFVAVAISSNWQVLTITGGA
jgi:hypothetical protein